LWRGWKKRMNDHEELKKVERYLFFLNPYKAVVIHICTILSQPFFYTCQINADNIFVNLMPIFHSPGHFVDYAVTFALCFYGYTAIYRTLLSWCIVSTVDIKINIKSVLC